MITCNIFEEVTEDIARMLENVKARITDIARRVHRVRTPPQIQNDLKFCSNNFKSYMNEK